MSGGLELRPGEQGGSATEILAGIASGPPWQCTTNVMFGKDDGRRLALVLMFTCISSTDSKSTV